MLDHAREAMAFAKDRSRDDLENDRGLQLILTRLLEVIGEAATRIPSEMREAHPTVPWRQVVGLRNRVIHAYDAVDLDAIWLVVDTDVPILITELEAILAHDR